MGYPKHRSDPATGAVAINVGGGDQTLERTSRGVYISGAGNLVVIMENGSQVTFAGLLAGQVYPISVGTIVASGSNATGLVLL